MGNAMACATPTKLSDDREGPSHGESPQVMRFKGLHKRLTFRDFEEISPGDWVLPHGVDAKNISRKLERSRRHKRFVEAASFSNWDIHDAMIWGVVSALASLPVLLLCAYISNIFSVFAGFGSFGLLVLAYIAPQIYATIADAKFTKESPYGMSDVFEKTLRKQGIVKFRDKCGKLKLPKRLMTSYELIYEFSVLAEAYNEAYEKRRDVNSELDRLMDLVPTERVRANIESTQKEFAILDKKVNNIFTKAKALLESYKA